jgi:hypothetical protein
MRGTWGSGGGWAAQAGWHAQFLGAIAGNPLQMTAASIVSTPAPVTYSFSKRNRPVMSMTPAME